MCMVVYYNDLDWKKDEKLRQLEQAVVFLKFCRGSGVSFYPTGYSPWRSNAVMSTTAHGRYLVLQIFKGRRGALDTTRRDIAISHHNLSLLWPSKFLFEYLLLPPRFALTTAPPGLVPKVLLRYPCPSTHRGLALALTA
ncbi:hypothetical protein LguiB_020722 [Lonicera macranthoides]